MPLSEPMDEKPNPYQSPLGKSVDERPSKMVGVAVIVVWFTFAVGLGLFGLFHLALSGMPLATASPKTRDGYFWVGLIFGALSIWSFVTACRRVSQYCRS